MHTHTDTHSLSQRSYTHAPHSDLEKQIKATKQEFGVAAYDVLDDDSELKKLIDGASRVCV
jgi:hypothetical protein